jgi:hypothetical protein
MRNAAQIIAQQSSGIARKSLIPAKYSAIPDKP